MRHLSTDLRRQRNTSNVLVGRGGRSTRGHTTTGTNRDGGSRIQKRLRHPHLPPLYYSVHNRDWENVLRRSRTHPHEILVQEDISGNTPLHVACRHDPPVDIVKALIIVCKERNNDGATPLHIAASYRCSDQVISALIEGDNQIVVDDDDDARGEFVTQNHTHSLPTILARTKMGRAPIHYACMSFRGLSVEAFKVLLESTIQSVNKYGNDGWWDGEDENLDNDNNTLDAFTLQDYTGQTPLGLLFRRYKERVRCVIKMVESSSNTTRAIAAVRADLNELWEKARFIVGMMAEQQQQRIDNHIPSEKTSPLNVEQQTQQSSIEMAAAMEAAKWAVQHHSYPQSSDDHLSAMTVTGRKFRIVHASVGLTGYGCPPEMIKLAISVHPDQVREMNEDGLLPIHIAAITSSYHNISSDNQTREVHTNDSISSPIINFNSSDEEERSLSSDYSELSNLKWEKHAFDKVIKLLLRKYPLSARIPDGKTGRLPLILAIEAKNRTWKDGIKTLFLSHPAALESKDINQKLYPTIFSFIGNNDDADEFNTHLEKGKQKRSNRATAMNALYQLIRAKPNIVRRKLEN